ncbi:MAG: EFR1 family ferrodoxin [Treponema sp.]|jgi:ferredoxin|nr:EFR1 family ferrodoxin [Treponema sp.]
MTKIYYFSGTGNSFWTAKKIMQSICEINHSDKCRLFNIGVEEQNEKILIEANTVVLVFPCYAYGMPLAVKRFVKKAVFKTPYVVSLVTFGSNPRGTLGALKRILDKKEIHKLFFALIPSVENYTAMFGSPKPELIKRRLQLQEETTKDAAVDIIERNENTVSTFTPFSSMVSGLFSLGVKIFYKHYKLSDKCDGCGICGQICPVSAITMKEKRPVFSSKCEHCQGCVNICPLRAIQFGRVKFGSPGYCRPGVQIEDLSGNLHNNQCFN